LLIVEFSKQICAKNRNTTQRGRVGSMGLTELITNVTVKFMSIAAVMYHMEVTYDKYDNKRRYDDELIINIADDTR